MSAPRNPRRDPRQGARPADRPGGRPTVGPASRPTAPAPRPATLRLVCLLVLLEAVALVVLAGALVVDLVRGAELPGAVAFLLAFALGVAVALVLAARALWAGRRWARSPVMTWQLLLLVLAIGWFGVEPAPWIVAVVLVAAVTGVCLVLPAVVAATTPRSGAR
ncbi:hypothetical protein [Cellulomonas hominis]